VNSLIAISDPDGGVPPEPIWGAWMLSTPSCVTVGCYPEQDGSTDVTMGSAQEIDPGYGPAYDGFLETPNKAVVVSTVDDEIIFRSYVPTTLTRLRVWVNRPVAPDRVFIGLG